MTTKPNCDCLVLTLDEPKEWLDRCLKSLKHPQINVIVCPGIKNSIGRARKEAFEKSSAEFVFFADPDDEYFPEIIVELLTILSRSRIYKSGYTGEFVQWTKENVEKPLLKYSFSSFHPSKLKASPLAAHGVPMFHRSHLQFFPDLDKFEKKYELWYCFLCLLKNNIPIFAYNRPGRIWHRHSSQTSKQGSLPDLDRITAVLEEVQV